MFTRQDGQDGKKRKENHATKVTKIPKTKRQKYGMNKTLEDFPQHFPSFYLNVLFYFGHLWLALYHIVKKIPGLVKRGKNIPGPRHF